MCYNLLTLQTNVWFTKNVTFRKNGILEPDFYQNVLTMYIIVKYVLQIVLAFFAEKLEKPKLSEFGKNTGGI